MTIEWIVGDLNPDECERDVIGEVLKEELPDGAVASSIGIEYPPITTAETGKALEDCVNAYERYVNAKQDLSHPLAQFMRDRKVDAILALPTVIYALRTFI